MNNLLTILAALRIHPVWKISDRHMKCEEISGYYTGENEFDDLSIRDNGDGTFKVAYYVNQTCLIEGTGFCIGNTLNLIDDHTGVVFVSLEVSGRRIHPEIFMDYRNQNSRVQDLEDLIFVSSKTRFFEEMVKGA